MVTILWRLEGSPAAAKSVGFGDVASGSWYGDAVNWAQSCGIVEGADGLFRPNDPVTREQLVTMLYRYAQLKGYDVSEGKNTSLTSYGDSASVSPWAVEAMKNIGFEVLPSKANFIFARHAAISGDNLYKGLRQRGILVRHFTKARIKDFVRITIGTQAQMERLVEALNEMTGGAK